MTILEPAMKVSRRFHVKGIPKSWAENTDEAGWKLFETLSGLILVDNISVYDSKYNSKIRFGILEVSRDADAFALMNSLDEKDRFHVAEEKCHITIRKFTELPPRSNTVRIKYSRDEIIALRKLGTMPPKIPVSVYPFICVNIKK